jgi:hypothetical protein
MNAGNATGALLVTPVLQPRQFHCNNTGALSCTVLPQDLLTRGNFTTWGLAIIASLMTMFASFWLFWINFFTMSPIQGMLQVYFIAFSILVLVLEMNPKYLPKYVCIIHQ